MSRTSTIGRPRIDRNKGHVIVMAMWLRAPRVFLSYRRRTIDKAQPIASELVYHALSVKIDVRIIEPGEKFGAKLERSVRHADVLVVLIDDRWLDEVDAQGTRLIDREEDWVRKEIELALWAGKRVIPVLLDNAPLPKAHELPESVRELVEHQYFRIRTTDPLAQDCLILATALWPPWPKFVARAVRAALWLIAAAGAVSLLSMLVEGLDPRPPDQACQVSFDALVWHGTKVDSGTIDEWRKVNTLENFYESAIRRKPHTYFGTKVACPTISHARCVKLTIAGRGTGKLSQKTNLKFGPAVSAYASPQWPSGHEYLAEMEAQIPNLEGFFLTDGIRYRRDDGVYWIGLVLHECATTGGQVDGHCVIERPSSWIKIEPAACPKRS